MKRCVQILMMTVALVAGAQAAQAAPIIAQFTWVEDLDLWDVAFKLENLDPVRTMSGIQVTAFTPLAEDAQFSLTLPALSASINNAFFSPGDVQSVNVSFVFDGVTYTGSRSRVLDGLQHVPGCDPNDPNCLFPLGYDEAPVLTFEERIAQMPEPVSLTLVALGLAVAVRRRRN